MNKQFTANVPTPSKMSFTGNMSQNWKKFKRQFENYAIASRLNKEEDEEYKVAVFLAIVGEEAHDIVDSLKFATPADAKKLDKVMEKLEEFFVGDTHEAYESYRFHLRRQDEGETIEAFIAALRKLAKNCNFSTLEERLIRDQVVVGVREEGLREKLLEIKDLTLDKCLTIGRAYEASKQQLHSMSAGTAEESQIQRLMHRKGKSGNPNLKRNQQQGDSSKEKGKCSRCGKYPGHARQFCPAKDAECRKCRKKGHYAALCRSKAVGQVMEEEEDLLGSVTAETSAAPSYINTVGSTWYADIEVTTSVRSKSVKFRLDTGADVTVVPARFFKANSPLIRKSDKKLYGPGRTELEVMGRVEAVLSTEKTTTKQELYLIPNLQEPLLGRTAIEELQLIKRVNEVKTDSEKDGASYRQEFPQLFSGLGRLKSTYTIRLKEDARPFAIASPRRLPLPQRQKVKEELKCLEEQDIIRPVNTPTDWCAPIVAVEKPNGKVRLCIDFTKLNDNIKRENFPLPTTDELLAQLEGATVFSKLDCNKGFHQIPLDEKSQELTTFITPFGRFCYKRLPFGICSGPEVFHREMTHIVADIPGVICDIDDILISGKDQEEHDRRLRQVLERLVEAGATLNEKCVFSASSVKFLGHIISA